ncbi:DUF4440 domain-containing protein [Sphingobium abikonense]|uniref:DUF4440 domain-containing protein n=1 Tax=Sphingobium abikonense TaxID=86193 RepID=UPI003515B83A
MEDARIWQFEESLWTGDPAHYAQAIDDEALMVVPAPPYVLRGRDAADAMADTPRWDSVDFAERQVMRPQEGLIVIAYKATARRGEQDGYEAHCTSTYRRLAHEEWRVVQHQQTPPLTAS